MESDQAGWAEKPGGNAAVNAGAALGLAAGAPLPLHAAEPRTTVTATVHTPSRAPPRMTNYPLPRARGGCDLPSETTRGQAKEHDQ